MKRSLLSAATLAFIFVCANGAIAQPLRISFNLSSQPNPYVAEWSSRRETAILTVTNTTNAPIDAKITARILVGTELRAETKFAELDVVTIPARSTQTFYGEDIAPFNAMSFYGGVETSTVRTGQIPAGSYTFCIQLLDPITRTALSLEVCRPFTIVNYQGPFLQLPADKSTLRQDERPTFRWTSVAPMPKSPVRYRFLVFEVLAGQSSMQAFRGNQPIIEHEVRGATQQLWLPELAEREAGMTYVWTVQALDNEGRAIGDRDGYADPFTFSIARTTARGNTNAIDTTIAEEGSGVVDRGSGGGTSGTGRSMGGTESGAVTERSGGGGESARSSSGGGGETVGGATVTEGLSTSKVDNLTSGGAPPTIAQPTNPQPPPSTCSTQPAQCTAPSCTPVATQQFGQGDSLTICGFKMILDSGVTGTNSSLSGSGTIRVKWMGTNVAVTFQNISVNDSNQVCSGTVLAKVDNEPDAYPQQWAINVVGSFNWSKNQVKKLNSWLHNKPWKMKKLKDVNVDSIFAEQTVIPVTVPLGFNDAEGITLAITEIKFEPTGAHLNAIAAFPVDLDLNDTLAFKGANFAFGPNAPLVSTGKLGLIDDVNFLGNVNNNATYEVTLKAEHDTAQGTFIRWDCKAFRELSLEMEVGYPREWLTPIPDNGQRVKTKIVTNLMSWKDWLVLASLPRCKVTNSNGLELEVISMVYDHSDTRNATGIVFPANYTGDQTSAFQGFYLKSTSVILPDKLRTFPNPSSPVKITVADMVINKLGITCDVVAQNVVNFPNQNIAGLGASIDTIKVSLINSSITSAYMRGKVTIPLCKPVASNSITYKALFNTGNGFQFTLSPTNPIEAEAFGAGQLVIENTSAFTIQIASGPAQFDMTLNAKFSFNDIKIGNKVKVSMKDLSVQALKMSYVSGSPMTFDIGTWSFASPPKWLAKIPLTIDKVEFAQKPKQPGEVLHGALAFNVILSLSENTISGRTRLEVEGAIDKPANDKFMPKFVSVKVKEIEIHATLAAVKIDGYANFYNDDPTYGDGFSGSLKAIFNSLQMQIDASARFGSTEFGSPGSPYRYWGVEAKAILPKPGIPFLPGVAFYGFGAGAWRRMNVTNMSKPDLNAVANANDTTKLTNTGATFTPNASNGFGFKVLAVVGTAPDPKSFNADASLMGEFSVNGGMTKIEFQLDGWAAAALLERDKAPVWGTMTISYVPPTKVFALNAQMNVFYPRADGNTIKTPSGPVWLALFINGMTGQWSFKLGEYQNLNTVRILNAFDVQEYLMFGNNITAAPGFLPKTIQGLNQAGVNVAFQNQGISTQASLGIGFAAGITVNGSTGDKYVDLAYRTKLKYAASGGFEVNLSMLRYPPTAMCDGVPLGMNGWYAQGGVAVWFAGYAGILITESPKRAWCCPCVGNGDNRCCDPFNCCALWCGSSWHPIISIKFGARLNAGFPRPTWANGDVSAGYDVCGGLFQGSFTAHMEIGKQCNIPAPEPVASFPAEDVVANIDKDGTLVLNINPSTGTTGYPPDNSIGVSLGFKPNDAFDVFERQADNTVKRRTFQARYAAKLDSLGIAYTGPGPSNPTMSANRTAPTTSGSGGPARGRSAVSISGVSGRGVSGNTAIEGGGGSQASAPSVPIVLTRSSQPSAVGEYDFRIYRTGPIAQNQWRQNMTDNTRYKFEITGELWEKVGANWVRATRRNGQQVGETRSVTFSTGVSPRINPTPINFNKN